MLTNEKFRARSIGGNEAAFYASGQGSAALMSSAALRSGIDLAEFKTCFELGCGLGRVTVWLAEIFPHLLAADISAPHLALAREAAKRFGRKNIDFMKLGTMSELSLIPKFDAFFSIIVLQHNPPPVIHYILGIMMEKLNPGGVAFFQVPTYWRGYTFDASDYARNINHSAHMEMHVLPQDALFALIEEKGCRVLEIAEDGATGIPDMVSNSLLVQKRL